MVALALRRPLMVGAVLLLLAGSASACSSHRETASPRESTKPTTEGAKAMDAREAREEVRSLYEATKKLVGSGWTEHTRSWWDCTRGGGGTGVDYSLFATRANRPLADEPRVVAEQARIL